MKIIILIGEAGAGKDLFYQILKYSNLEVKRYAFADEVKEDLITHFGIPRKLLFGTKKYLYHKTDYLNIREICQAYGMYVRSVNEDYWADIVCKKIKEGSIAVITDCRFKNEINHIKTAYGAENVKTVRINRTTKKENLNHISELELKEYETDYTLDNNGSIDDFKTSILKIL
jgi:predicted ATPase